MFSTKTRVQIVLLIATHTGSLIAQQTSKATLVGAQACGSCHAVQFAQQTTSGHSRSLSPAPEHRLAGSFSSDRQLLRNPNFHFQFRLSAKEFRVRAFDDRDVVDVPIEWAFGAGEQAVTFVSRVNEDWYLEHYFTYYSATQSLGPTPGQEALQPDTLPLALGLLYKPLDPDTGILGCFQCHSTGPVAVGPRREMQPAQLGVRCEACHGPGSLHIEAAARGPKEKITKLIQNPNRMSAVELNKFCGTCHRPPAAPGIAIDWNNAWNVRHQPVYISQSACFQKSNGALSCLTCHHPHKALRKNDAAYYNEQCVTCHTTTTHPPKAICVTSKPANCADCHMPRVSPQGYLRFTNHWIGVYGEGAKLKPLR